ncbi:VOC family protein [Jiangella ureilytica]|uniref:VOC family protein n=1 Tax=Jiangella ureilytica TaxID=2530374 RepID=A0A4R4R9Y6_9ACTN|nr:VOC family protein [Jiangella ureilytica]TDC45770.1 VOC family protein [Jiangella ureilytica]
MSLDLFAGIYVRDYAAVQPWYVRLLGSEPTFLATETEAVWQLADHRWLYIKQHPEHGGHAVLAIMVDDLDAQVAQIAERGIEPVQWEEYPNDVRKAVFRDPEGNEVGFGVIPG